MVRAMSTSDEALPAEGSLSPRWILNGAWQAISLPLVVLSTTFFAFGAFARDLGFPLWQMVMLSGAVWAMPSSVVFVVSVSGGASLFAAALAVALSAVRLLPMTIALMPQMSAERVNRLWFYLGSHFVAVTAYVEAIMRFPRIPPEVRLSFFIGMGLSLTIISTSVGVLGYLVAGALPPVLAGGLLFVTPLYFLLSIVAAATKWPERAAVAFGFILGPIAHRIEPELDLLWAGLIGGTGSYAVHLLMKRRRAR
jgi:predicted branched-subunit amino acid permease